MGWKTAKLASEELSFRYPADWTLKGGADNIAVTSPVSDNHYFEIDLIVAADSRDVNLNFLGEARALPILDLKAKYNRLPLYLVASTPTFEKKNVAGLELAVTPASASTTLGIDKSKTVSGKYITMNANLLPVTTSLGDSRAEYPLQRYKDSAIYATVLQVFKSILGR